MNELFFLVLFIIVFVFVYKTFGLNKSTLKNVIDEIIIPAKKYKYVVFELSDPLIIYQFDGFTFPENNFKYIVYTLNVDHFIESSSTLIKPAEYEYIDTIGFTNDEDLNQYLKEKNLITAWSMTRIST